MTECSPTLFPFTHCSLCSNTTMKYVYRAMANPAGQNCTKLLQWHEKLYEKVREHWRAHADCTLVICSSATFPHWLLTRSFCILLLSVCRMALVSSCARLWIARSTAILSLPTRRRTSWPARKWCTHPDASVRLQPENRIAVIVVGFVPRWPRLAPRPRCASASSSSSSAVASPSRIAASFAATLTRPLSHLNHSKLIHCELSVQISCVRMLNANRRRATAASLSLAVAEIQRDDDGGGASLRHHRGCGERGRGGGGGGGGGCGAARCCRCARRLFSSGCRHRCCIVAAAAR